MQAEQHETIKRYVFRACEQDQHQQCQVWQSGYVDGLLRSAGEQCSCVCHNRKRGTDVETD